MTLLNGLLSIGALAFTIPLAIHLLFRSRFRRVEWGAMHLLADVARVNHRRLQWQYLLLMLLRCLIPVLLAFCLARPVLTGFRALPGDDPQTLVLAIDDSRSMSARSADGVATIDRMRPMIAELLASLHRSDEVMIVRSSDPTASASPLGRATATRRIGDMIADSGPVDFPRLLNHAHKAAATAANAHRRVIVVSDFQNHDLSDTVLQTIGNGDGKDTDWDQSSVALLDLSAGMNPMANVLVESITLDAPIAIAGRPFRISAEIRNEGDQSIGALRLLWKVNDQTYRSSEISIEGRSVATVRIDHRLEEPGNYQFSLTLEYDDAIVADNRRAVMIAVINEVSVLIAQAETPRDTTGQGNFLQFALSPFAFAGDVREDPIRTTVIRPDQIAGQLGRQANQVQVLVVDGVDHLKAPAKASIVDYVSAGGSLVIFDGDDVEIDSYNQIWRSTYDRWRLPARLGEIADRSAGADTAAIEIGQVAPTYVPWSQWIGPNETPFRQVNVQRYRQLVLDQANDTEDTLPQSTKPIMLAANQQPLAVVGLRGRGRVVQFAISSDDSWTNLPLRPIYVPLMQQLILDLAKPESNQPSDLDQVPISESILQPATPQRLAAFADALNAKSYDSATDIAADNDVDRYGREIWIWLLAVLLMAMVAEVLVQQWMQRATATSASKNTRVAEHRWTQIGSSEKFEATS